MKTTPVLYLLALLFTACAGIPEPSEASEHAQHLLDLGMANEAAECLDEQPEPDNRIRMLRAEAAVQLQQLADAQRRYQQILDDRSTMPDMRDLALRNLAAVALMTNNPGKAYASLDQVSDEQKKKPELQRDLGVAAVASGRLDVARQHFAQLPKQDRQKVEEVLGRDFFANR